MKLNRQQIVDFQETLWEYYAQYGRNDLPWRQPEPAGNFETYKIMVSELMLQQTQVPRVILKYIAFLKRFPNMQALARAELGDVLREWQGLGYNRRAKFLWQTARLIGTQPSPDTLAGLVQLPGIGPNTAGAILAYAFNQPAVFIETNVRTVYIHHFFASQTGVADKDIQLLVEQTLDQENPREFYWALMDYGSHLKSKVGNANKASKHYVKQSKFQGSRRQVRGQVIRLLGERSQTLGQLQSLIADERLEAVLAELVSEELIRKRGSTFIL